ncbi:MAG TPA: hypothetical protein PJ982_15990, partial [Lacipirellulaceae bacterium]|nr:hypothetical protein [Lacipirellulaceae bacterium]
MGGDDDRQLQLAAAAELHRGKVRRFVQGPQAVRQRDRAPRAAVPLVLGIGQQLQGGDELAPGGERRATLSQLVAPA